MSSPGFSRHSIGGMTFAPMTEQEIAAQGDITQGKWTAKEAGIAQANARALLLNSLGTSVSFASLITRDSQAYLGEERSRQIQQEEHNLFCRVVTGAFSGQDDWETVIWRANLWQAAVVGSEEAFRSSKYEPWIWKPGYQFWVSDHFYVYETPRMMSVYDLPEPCVWQMTFQIPFSGVHIKRGGVISRNGAGCLTVCLFTPRIVNKQSPVIYPVYYWSLYGEPCMQGAEWCWALQAFMQQKFVVLEKEQASRSDRRRYEKQGIHLPEISVVTLRRAHYESRGDQSQSLKEHDCSWLVGSYWRRPAPNMKEPRPVYVKGHLKGNPDKPLKPPRKTIFDVKR